MGACSKIGAVELQESSYKVYIVDDDQGGRDSMAALMESKGLQVESFSSAHAFLERYRNLPLSDRPSAAAHGLPIPAAKGSNLVSDCLICDLRMPGKNGLALQQELRHEGLRIPIIFVTAYGSIHDAVEAMEGGAITFLEKPCREADLWDAVQRALEIDESNSVQHYRLELRRRLDELTEGEIEVLNMLIDGVPNRQIAEAFDISLRTVELRRSKIMKKMQAGSLAQLIRYTLEARGWHLTGSRDPQSGNDSAGMC